MKHTFYTVALLLIGLLTATACSAEIRPAQVSAVTVELRDGVHIAIAEGDYPDACAAIGPTVQTVDGNTVKVGLVLKPPSPDMMCAQMITPYTEEIVLDTRGLPPGDYEANVNGVRAPFAIEPDMQAQPETLFAPVASIEIDQRADGNVLIISGEMPDACHEVGEVSQHLEGEELRVEVEMTPPGADMMCAQVITPYTVEVPIDATLEPGQYTVTVNDIVVDVTVY